MLSGMQAAFPIFPGAGDGYLCEGKACRRIYVRVTTHQGRPASWLWITSSSLLFCTSHRNTGVTQEVGRLRFEKHQQWRWKPAQVSSPFLSLAMLPTGKSFYWGSEESNHSYAHGFLKVLTPLQDKITS